MSRCLAAILVVLSGCAVAPGTEVPTPQPGPLDPPPRTGSAVDPVCGTAVDGSTSWRAEQAGVEYLFHARECRDEFVTNPEAFLGNSRHPGYSRAQTPLRAKDPVCGRELEVRKALRETYRGDPVFFHADECRRWFLADPTAFVDDEGRPRDFTAR